VVRGNLRVHLSDAVNVSKMKQDVKNAKKIIVVPFADTIEGLKVPPTSLHPQTVIEMAAHGLSHCRRPPTLAP
jgi:hypothetical protein